MDPTNPAFHRPPVLDGTNYSYWKVRTRSYIKSIDSLAWKSVLVGWSPPRIPDVDGDNVFKRIEDYTRDEASLANANDKALNVILSSVDMSMFRMVKNCSVAKDAWEILERHCEGDHSIRETRLRMVQTRFENLRMESGENVKTYFSKILEIANEASELGEPISNRNLVSKALRSLPEKFNVKISSIEEAHNTATMDINHLMSILVTHEINLDHQKNLYNRSRDVNKSVALSVGITSREEESEDDEIEELGENDDMALLTQKFNNIARRLKGKKNTKIPSTPETPTKRLTHPPKATPTRRIVTSRYESKDVDSVQCHACKGFGHYAKECANTLRKYGKAMAVSMSDDEDEGDEKEDTLTLLASCKETMSESKSPTTPEVQTTPKAYVQALVSPKSTEAEFSGKRKEVEAEPNVTKSVATSGTTSSQPREDSNADQNIVSNMVQIE